MENVNRNKILLFIRHITDSGEGRVLTLWADFLCQAGYDVTLMTYYKRPDEYVLNPQVKRHDLFNSVTDFEAPVRKKFFNARLQNLPAELHDAKLLHCASLFKQYIAQSKPDLIIPFMTEPNIITALANHQHQTAVLQTIRNSPWDDTQSQYSRAVRDWAIQQQGTVILQNTEQTEYFDTPEFANVKKYIVHNPLNPVIATLAKDSYGPIKKIVTAGRLHEQKNQKMMIDAVKIINDDFNYDCKLDIFGAGPLEKDLQQYIDEQKLKDQVTLRGRSNNIFPEMVKYDLNYLTSLYEGTPNALLEAMGLGLPCISTICRTGPKELINHERNGFLLDSYDPRDLAKLTMKINRPELLARIGQQARQDMRRYSQANCLAELQDCITDALAMQEQRQSADKTLSV